MAMLVSVVADFDNKAFTTKKGADLSHKQKTIAIWITHICLYGISWDLANV